MQRKAIYITALIIITLSIITNKVYSEPIRPINNIYKEGIYNIDNNDKDNYELHFKFVNTNEKSTLIILDENDDVLYKSIVCDQDCNAGVINNKNTIIVIGGEIKLDFKKANK